MPQGQAPGRVRTWFKQASGRLGWRDGVQSRSSAGEALGLAVPAPQPQPRALFSQGAPGRGARHAWRHRAPGIIRGCGAAGDTLSTAQPWAPGGRDGAQGSESERAGGSAAPGAACKPVNAQGLGSGARGPSWAFLERVLVPQRAGAGQSRAGPCREAQTDSEAPSTAQEARVSGRRLSSGRRGGARSDGLLCEALEVTVETLVRAALPTALRFCSPHPSPRDKPELQKWRERAQRRRRPEEPGSLPGPRLRRDPVCGGSGRARPRRGERRPAEGRGPCGGTPEPGAG